MPVFLTFASAKFEQALRRIEAEAAASGFFDRLFIRRPADLSKSFWRKHGAFVRTEKRGYGYWLWKPWLIAEQLSQCRPDEILIYADAGSTVNAAGRRRFDEYCGLVRDAPTGVLAFQIDAFPEKWYTKGDVFGELDAWHLKDTPQAIATIVLWRRCETSLSLARDWLRLSERYPLISDAPSVIPNDPAFVKHRYDQSLFSLLAKLAGATLIPDETNFSHWRDATNVPIWSTRFRG